jgi:hypothetical protein
MPTNLNFQLNVQNVCLRCFHMQQFFERMVFNITSMVKRVFTGDRRIWISQLLIINVQIRGHLHLNKHLLVFPNSEGFALANFHPPY